MPKKIETLYDDEWVSLKKLVYPEKHVGGYTYSHETRCDGKIIVILPYMITDCNISYLLRDEVTPCWEIEKSVVSSLTGGYEKSKGMKGTVVMELKEEGGYTVKEKDLISLGTCRGSKSSDTIYHLFSVDLTGKKRGEAKGDGSVLESLAKCFWANDLKDCEDPMAYVCHHRLNIKFMEKLHL